MNFPFLVLHNRHYLSPATNLQLSQKRTSIVEQIETFRSTNIFTPQATPGVRLCHASSLCLHISRMFSRVLLYISVLYSRGPTSDHSIISFVREASSAECVSCSNPFYFPYQPITVVRCLKSEWPPRIGLSFDDVCFVRIHFFDQTTSKKLER